MNTARLLDLFRTGRALVWDDWRLYLTELVDYPPARGRTVGTVLLRLRASHPSPAGATYPVLRKVLFAYGALDPADDVFDTWVTNTDRIDVGVMGGIRQYVAGLSEITCEAVVVPAGAAAPGWVARPQQPPTATPVRMEPPVAPVVKVERGTRPILLEDE
jgi:hypothetical protein